MKEIVIKIPDNMLDVIKNSENTTWLAVTYGNQLVWQVKNGKVLPKGHDRLIEVTPRLEMYLSTFQSYTGIDEAPYEYADKLIRNADTVVEADKGESEEE